MNADTVLTESGLQRIVGRLLLGWNYPQRPDLAGDCMQVARLCLLEAAPRLDTLPDADRAAYATVCIRRAVWRYLQRERRYQTQFISLEEFRLDARRAAEMAIDLAAGQEALDRDDWLDHLQHDGIAHAASVLSPMDRTILGFYYGSGLMDREIAQMLDTSVGSVEQRRNRALHKLRAAVVGKAEGRRPADDIFLKKT